MTTDASGRDLFVSPDGEYHDATNLCVYSTGIVPEPSTIGLLLASAACLLAFTWRKRRIVEHRATATAT